MQPTPAMMNSMYEKVFFFLSYDFWQIPCAGEVLLTQLCSTSSFDCPKFQISGEAKIILNGFEIV